MTPGGGIMDVPTRAEEIVRGILIWKRFAGLRATITGPKRASGVTSAANLARSVGSVQLIHVKSYGQSNFIAAASSKQAGIQLPIILIYPSPGALAAVWIVSRARRSLRAAEKDGAQARQTQFIRVRNSRRFFGRHFVLLQKAFEQCFEHELRMGFFARP